MCETISLMNELERAVRDYRKATQAADAARERLAEAIARAARDGVRQADIVKITGYTREHVRRICRAAGIEAS